MKRLILALLLSVSYAFPSIAQRNYPQDLINLLQQGRAFEARDLRVQHADKLPINDKTLDLLYKAEMASFFNKPDDAAVYLEDLVVNHEFKLGPAIGVFYKKLLSVYDSQQRFKNGIKICDKYLGYLIRNPLNQDRDFIQNETNYIEKAKESFIYRDSIEPRIKIERTNSREDQTAKLNDSEYIRFDAKYNGVTTATLFDTGLTAHFMITRSLADKIGAKLVNKRQDSVQMFNGVPTKIRIEIIEKVEFAGVRLYNIPVLVFNDNVSWNQPDTLNAKTKSNIERTLSDEQVIMGLPAMKLIGRIALDWENRTVSFPHHTEKTDSSDFSNMYLTDNNLFLKLKVNGLAYVGNLCTGSDDFLNMRFSFYEKNKSQIEIDSVTQKRPFQFNNTTGSSFNIPHEIVKDAKIYLNGRGINHNIGDVLVWDKNLIFNTFDGGIGVRLFKRLGPRITLDFDNMRLKASD
ncbi:retropepsin-like aspartic protease [Arcticibacter tournemirensis]